MLSCRSFTGKYPRFWIWETRGEKSEHMIHDPENISNGGDAPCSHLECEVERRADDSRLLQRQLWFDVVPGWIWIPVEVQAHQARKELSSICFEAHLCWYSYHSSICNLFQMIKWQSLLPKLIAPTHHALVNVKEKLTNLVKRRSASYVRE